ncbi:hypothetical protein ABIE88_008536 [Bradyrhizobium diazoefficiens]|uniref:tail completion protein gp17 n=1 Tax=Bradyrhizobium TaxID=374 RepID=UPI003184340F
MMDIRPGLFAFFAADSVIGPLVTASGVSRIFPIVLPQGVKLTSIVYTRISGQGDYTMQGASGYTAPRYQIAAWAPTADAAVRLANAIKDAFDGFKGAIGTGNDAVDVQGVFCGDQRETYDDIVQMFGVMRDYFVHHGEL